MRTTMIFILTVALFNSAIAQIQSLQNWIEEKDDIIRFSVTSNGRTAEEWIKFLEANELIGSDDPHDSGGPPREIIRSDKFKATKGVKYNIVLVKDVVFADAGTCEADLSKVYGGKFTSGQKLGELPIEAALLIFEQLVGKSGKQKKSGWLKMMMAPVQLGDHNSVILATFGRELEALGQYGDKYYWCRDDFSSKQAVSLGYAYAFLVSR
jgi:hypothetical protein